MAGSSSLGCHLLLTGDTKCCHGIIISRRVNDRDDDAMYVMQMVIMTRISLLYGDNGDNVNGDNDMNFPSLWVRSGNVFHGPPTAVSEMCLKSAPWAWSRMVSSCCT